MLPWLLALVLAAAPLPPGSERRCGWLHNPTPANYWLTDRDGEWLMEAQGGYSAEGMENLGNYARNGWVVTNGVSYGYGCVCMTATTDRRERRVVELHSIRSVPLRQCRRDRRLPRL